MLRIVCLLLLLLPAVAHADLELPKDANAAREQVLDLAHKSWRRDAIVTQISLVLSPGGVNVKPERAWLLFSLFSPSNHHTAFVTMNGGDDDLMINEGRDVAPEDVGKMRAIPAFKLDLSDALAAASKTGLRDNISNVMLRVGEANGNPPVLAWVMNLGSQRFFPLVLDAQTGEELSWKRIMSPPTTDKQIADAWRKFLHRNDRPAHADNRVQCFSGVPTAEGMCLSFHGDYVNPVTGTR